MPKAKTTTKKKSRLTKKQMKQALKPVSTKKAKAQRNGAGRVEAAAAAALSIGCLDAVDAAFIVGSCLLPGNHENDDTLEETGLISPNLRSIFRECVFNGVSSKGCSIQRGQIPNGADATVGDVKQAVMNNAS